MSHAFDAFHLPGLAAHDRGQEWAELAAGNVRLRYPILDARQVGALAERLRAARERTLADRPVSHVVRALDDAAALLTAPGDLRTLALDLLPAVTRMSPPMVELILDRMAGDWRAPALERLLAAELGDPAVLDRFVDEPAAVRSVRALGPRLALNVFAGNVPGVAVSALVRCLLVKAAIIGKTAADDPVLPVLFARALHRVDADLADCVAVTYWPGGQSEAEAAALGEADTIIVYGGGDAVQSIRSRAPGHARVLEHGPRMSLGFVAREALEAEGARALARAIALAAATFDQHGCVSLQGAFIERGGAVSPRDMAGTIFEELRALGDSLPPGSLLPAEAAALQAERGRAEFALMAGEAGRAGTEAGVVMATGDTRATVVYSEQPDPTPSCLDRFVRVSAVDSIEEAIAALEPFAGLLQTAGLATTPGRERDLAERLGRVGFTRIAPFGSMPWPPATWHHDGASPLRELVRWVDLEPGPAGHGGLAAKGKKKRPS